MQAARRELEVVSQKTKGRSFKLLASKVFLVLCLLFSVFLFSSKTTFAALSACDVTIEPSVANVNSNTDFSIQVTNNDDNYRRMVWIKIIRPSADYTIVGAGDNGFSANRSESEFSTWGFDVGIGSAYGQNITTSVNDDSTFTGFWTVLASDDPDGNDPTTCMGALDARIFDPVNSVPPVISDLTISDISDSSIKISWTTDKVATSVVDYGIASDYGLNKTDATLSTAHSVTVDGLTANTSYHYRVTSVDDHNNTTQTSDNTFSSAVAGAAASTTTTTVVVVTQAASTTNTITKIVADTTPPSISIATDFSKPFKEAPKITGKSTDNKAVSKIEYSLDNGRNWQPVDNANLGKASTVFDFAPVSLDDDNYKLKVRSTDSSGNVGLSKVYTMVIDRLPPDVGQSFFSLGPLPLIPDSDGAIVALEGLNQKITLSLVGGPTTVDITANSQMFSLVKNTDNGLWSGIMNFDKTGIYSLTVNSVDGAGNKSGRTLHPVIVLPGGTVNSGSRPIKDAKVTVKYLDVATKRFVVWDGASYGQKNPQNTDKDGKYSLFMPVGTYYLEIAAPGFRAYKTNIFKVEKSMPLNSDFRLVKKQGLVFGPLNLSFLDFSVTDGIVSFSQPNLSDDKKQKLNIIGKNIPDVDLKNPNSNAVFPTSGLSGKITVLSFLSTWDPFTPVQLGILNTAKKQTDASLITVFPQESASKVYIYKKRGNYDLTFLADPDGLLVKPLNIETMPFHVFLNRKGIVTKVKYGVLSVDELLGNLIN